MVHNISTVYEAASGEVEYLHYAKADRQFQRRSPPILFAHASRPGFDSRQYCHGKMSQPRLGLEKRINA